MAKREVGKGRGGVYVGGTFYGEGTQIPDDVEVGSHVFDDADDVIGNVPAGPNIAFGAALSAGNAEQAQAAADRDAGQVREETTVEQALEQAGVEAPSAEASGGESRRSRKSS